MNFAEKIGDALLGRKSAITRAFEAALERGDTEYCLIVIEQQPSLAKKFERSVVGEDSLLMASIRAGNAEVCNKLLQNGAKLNVPLKFAGDTETALSAVARPDYPHSAVKEVLLDHFKAREATKTHGLLDQLKVKTSSLFKTISDTLDNAIKHPGVTLAGVSMPTAAVGTVLGGVAAGASLSVLAPAAVGAAAVGIGVAAISSLRANNVEAQDMERIDQAEATFKELAKHHVPKVKPEGQEVRDDSKVVAVSEVVAQQYVEDAGHELRSVDTAKGRYSGPLVHQTERHVVQDLGRGSVAVHNKDNIDQRLIQAAILQAKSARIQYRDGRAMIDSGVGQNQSREHSR